MFRAEEENCNHKTQRPQDRERAILAAARKALVAVGVERVTIARVAKAARIAPGTVYFSRKDILIQTAVEHWLNEFDARMRSALSDVGDPLDQLRRFLDVYREHMDADLDFFQNLGFTPTVAYPADARNRRLEHYYVPYLRALTGVSEAGIAQGVLRKLHPKVTAVAVHSLLLGYCWSRTQRLNRTTKDSYTPSPTVRHFPARPERSEAKSKGVESGPAYASTSPCGLRSA